MTSEAAPEVPDELRQYLLAAKRHPRVYQARIVTAGGKPFVEAVFEPAVAQERVADIHVRESFIIGLGDGHYQPLVISCRPDFPRLPHTQPGGKGDPVALCLFAEDWYQVREKLTAYGLIDRIHEWLVRAASGGLHLPGQPLEPLVVSGSRVAYLRSDYDKQDFKLKHLYFDGSRKLLYLGPKEDRPGRGQAPTILPIHYQTAARVGLTIMPQPQTLTDFIDAAGVEIAEVVELILDRLWSSNHGAGHNAEVFAASPLLIFRIPKCRRQGEPAEAFEHTAVLVQTSFGELAHRLGFVEKSKGSYGRLISRQAKGSVADIKVESLRPTPMLDRDLAVSMAGTQTPTHDRLVAIGAGALGSHVILNLAREGIGRWRIIDHDIYLPHNAARHVVSVDHIGIGKAQIVATEVQGLLADADAAEAVEGNVHLLLKSGDLSKHLADAARIFDFSASAAVLRVVARADSAAARSAFYMTRNGRYLIGLQEGHDRSVRLDDLDVQALSAAVLDGVVPDAFDAPFLSSVQYSGSCGDVTAVLPQSDVAVHAGIAARSLRLAAAKASIMIWKLTDDGVRAFPIKVSHVRIFEECGWQIRVSKHALDQMGRLRSSRLPRETGGVLIGSISVLSQTVYVSAVLPAPPDSVERPATFIRGAQGLAQQVTHLNERSNGELVYVGEWHSHPDGAGTSPSELDLAALNQLRLELGAEGLPAVMCIRGQRQEATVLVRGPE